MMDFANNKSVPFEISDINHGLQKAKGLLKLIKGGIELEFEVQDSFFGMINSGVQAAQFSYKDLESIQFEKGWLSAKIILEANSIQVFADLPGSEQGRCTLKVKRKHKKEAQDLISKARLEFSEFKLDQLDED